MTMQVVKTLQSSARRDKRRGSTHASFVPAKTDSAAVQIALGDTLGRASAEGKHQAVSLLPVTS